jgi:Ca-activated chloride channel family protein
MTKPTRRALCCALLLALAPACLHDSSARAPQKSGAAPAAKPSSQPSPSDEAPRAEVEAEPPQSYEPMGGRELKRLTQDLGIGGVGRGGGGKVADGPSMRRESARSESQNAGILGVLSASSSSPAANLQPAEFNREAYAHVAESDFHQVKDQALSTFSIDVDTASYSNVRRFLRDGQLPPADAVRIEELVNYFDYDYPRPEQGQPFATYAEVAACPWNPAHQLVHIGIAGQRIADAQVPARNLVFLIDVSGSMQDPDKLPLLKRGMALLARSLRPQDRVAMVVYAGSSGLVLPPTAGSDQARILDALERLEAGGSTNGAEGIELAYREAQRSFISGGINRVILATDGDFNVGVTSEGELTRLIEQKRKSGVFLTVLGFGRGNLQDSRMEQLADKGNGNYAYIDDLDEAHKVLVREAGATLVTIAKDVKLQVEFNPERVESYRLVGYENRALAARDFNDDKKDAGEIGAGHTVTALYEIVPRVAGRAAPSEVDALRYQGPRAPLASQASNELLSVKIRYKAPNADVSKLLERQLSVQDARKNTGSDLFRFAAAVAEFGMLLRNSSHKGSASLEQVRQLAEGARAADPEGERAQFLDMVQASARLGLGS